MSKFTTKLEKENLSPVDTFVNNLIYVVISYGVDPMEKITLHLTAKEYGLATEYQELYYKIFDKCLTLEELFKTAVFLEFLKLKQNPKATVTKQTTLRGLI